MEYVEISRSQLKLLKVICGYGQGRRRILVAREAADMYGWSVNTVQSMIRNLNGKGLITVDGGMVKANCTIQGLRNMKLRQILTDYYDYDVELMVKDIQNLP